jgi:signal transduction histidine kinase
MTENVRGKGVHLDVHDGNGRLDVEALDIELKELRASRKRLAVAADAERRSIERALHDGVQQRLVGIAANVDLLRAAVERDAGAEQLVGEMERDLRAALEEARALAGRIYPPLLDAGGLGVAVRAAAAERRIAVGLDVALKGPIPVWIASTIYFCCLDMLERVDAKTPVGLAVRERPAAVDFEISAACDAFDAETSVRDRVEAMEGDLTFTLGDGPSTHVTASLPLL